MEREQVFEYLRQNPKDLDDFVEAQVDAKTIQRWLKKKQIERNNGTDSEMVEVNGQKENGTFGKILLRNGCSFNNS